jgi:hypothetical protein
MASASSPDMRKAGLEGLQDLNYRKSFQTSLKGPQPQTPSLAEQAPRLPPMQNFLSPQESFESPALTMGNAPNQFAPPSVQKNLLANARSYGDPVLENLFDMRDKYVAAIQTSGGKYREAAEKMLTNVQGEIDIRLKQYESVTLNPTDVRMRTGPDGKMVEVARAPSALEQLQDSIANETDPVRKGGYRAVLWARRGSP